MSGDPQFDPTDDADAELSSLFAAMREDRAPAGFEARALAALAATTAATATATATAGKLGLWSRLALFLNAHGVAASAILGGLCGVLVCGIHAAVDHPAAGPSGGVDAGPIERGVPVAATAVERPREAPARAEGEAATAAPASSPAAPPVPAASIAPVASPHAAPAAAPAVAPADTPPAGPAPIEVLPPPPAGPGPAPREPVDLLRRELLLVRSIAALVDAGRCADARAVIARYQAEHAGGQLSSEVAVLAARCQGR